MWGTNIVCRLVSYVTAEEHPGLGSGTLSVSFKAICISQHADWGVRRDRFRKKWSLDPFSMEPAPGSTRMYCLACMMNAFSNVFRILLRNLR